jgi:hypothetical protein
MRPMSLEDDNPFTDFMPKEKEKPRPPPVPEEEEEEDYAPVATEMRKRLAASGTERAIAVISDESDAPQPAKDAKSKAQKGKKRVQEEENDEVITAARERKRIALEQSKIAAEELAAAVKDHANLRNLGTVETYSVDLTPRPLNREDRSSRWNPMWNGRKNFKKFRKVKQSVSITVGREMIRLVDYKGTSPASQGRLFVLVTNAFRAFLCYAFG